MKNIRVMIVEDDQVISFLHREMLKKNNIAENPLSFLNGKEALDFILRDTSDHFYLILLDLNMPVMNGWQFLDKVEKEEGIAYRTKVAIVTSSINPADKARAGEYEMVDFYLSKPLLECKEIKKAIKDLKTLSRQKV